MADTDVVRITFKEIQSMAEAAKEDSQKEDPKSGNGSKRRKKTKRPEIPIYRPGQMRVSKQDKDTSNREQRASSEPLEGENWEPEQTRAAYGTTDEDSSRGSKENSVDKDMGGGGGRDSSRFTPSPSAPSHKGEGGGRRRSKRPDIQIYVPKPRMHDSQRWDEDEADSVSGGYAAGSDVSPKIISSPGTENVADRLDSLHITEQADQAAPSTLSEDHSSQTGATATSGSNRQRQNSGQQHDKAGRDKDRQNYRSHPQFGSGGGDKGHHHDDKGRNYEGRKEGHSDRESNAWSETERSGTRRHSEDNSGFREHRAGRGRGRGDRDSFRDRRAGRGRGQGEGDFYKDVRPGRGRGRNRHQQYNRSSSSESLTKSVDLGHRAQWPAERIPQQGGTFPRSKRSKNKNTPESTDLNVSTESLPGQPGGKHAFSSMRAPRERSGSISSDTSGGSDISWEDMEAEFEREKPDWNTQVEQYLEEVARQVQDSTQRLTDSIDNSFHGEATPPTPTAQTPQPNHKQPALNRNLSASSDHIFSQEYRGRKKDRRRKGSQSKNSSRDSSIHSNPRDDNLWQAESKRAHRRRNRRRPSSAGPTNRVGTVEGQRAAESLRIMVGKNKEKRQVVVKGKEVAGETSDGNRRPRHHSGSESNKPDHDHHPRHAEGEGGGRGRGGRRDQGHTGEQQRWRGEGHGRGRGKHDDRGKKQPGGMYSNPPSHNQRFQSGGTNYGSDGGGDPYFQPGSYPRSAPSPGACSDSGLPSTSHTGGLIKLPAQHPSSYQPRQDHGNTRNQGHRQDRSHGPDVEHEQFEDRFRRSSGSGGQGSGQGERRLYDPKNPTKPIRVPDTRPLHFQDTDEPPHSPSPFHDQNYPSSPLSHSPGHVEAQGICPPPPGAGSGPGFPPFFPPHHPGFMYPPPHMAMPFPGYPHGPPPPPPPNHPMFYGFQPSRPLGEVDEAYLSRELEQTVRGMSRPQCRMMAEQVLRDTTPLDCQLTNILSRPHPGQDAQRRVKQLRLELQRRYERVLLLDIDVANQRAVEQQLWRSVYYNVIEGLRRQQTPDNNGQDTSTTKQALNAILDEGTAFYEALLTKLQDTYSFSLDALLEDGGSSATEGGGRGVRLAILSAQRTMMFLGDIARYREQAAQSANYGKARHWYIQAQKLAPKNGRPYNQLAILAVYTRRKLDAVYYYQRSLAASNPILTARESLMSLFDDVRRKEEAVEQKRVEKARRKRRRRPPHSRTRHRVEVWVAPDGSCSHDQQSDRESDTDDLSGLSSIELNKRFVLTFLNVHGKLFTKINFEVFVETASLMLEEWRLLLQHSPSLLTPTRLVHIAAINMFSIDNTALKDESLEASCRSLLQEHAVEVALDMFGLLVARVNQLLLQHLASTAPDPDDPAQGRVALSEDVRQLLTGVKVMVDWMMCHSALWNPQPSLRPPDVGPQVDVWKNVADLCNTLKQFNTSHVTLHRNKQPGFLTLVLMEDTMMAGFVPLLSAPVDTAHIAPDQDKEEAMDCLRLEKIVLFGEYLCGIEPPMLAFDVERGRYFSVAPAPVKSEEKLAEPSEDIGTELTEDVIVESEESGEDGDETPGETIKELKARKAELRQQVEDQARNKHTLQTLLEQSSGSRLELEVRPRFLVTDTNCFIDHLPALRSLLALATYTLVVPLVVVNELDGLAKGSNQGQGHWHDNSPEHVAMVTRHANQALAFLESEFKARNSRLRVLTSKGSVLETLAFRSEESDNSGNNDDLILSCCLHYCKDMARDFMPKEKDSPVRLFRDVVLLTDDRNLRLKAHTSNVPVKDVPAFCRWTKVT